MNQTAEELLKVDALGRVWTTAERREWLLDEFERSGVAGAEFARLGLTTNDTEATKPWTCVACRAFVPPPSGG